MYVFSSMNNKLGICFVLAFSACATTGPDDDCLATRMGVAGVSF